MKGTNYKDIFNQETNSTNLLSGTALIRNELEFLLSFKKYSLFFGNNMGLDCEKYLGLSNRVATFNLIKSDIEDLFRKYKRAIIKNIKMVFNDDDNSIRIDITAVLSRQGKDSIINIPLVLSN